MPESLVKPRELEISIEIPDAPFSPWLRLGIIDSTPRRPWTHVRYIDSFEFHLQLEGSSWTWLEAVGGSIDVVPGDLIFFPPGLVHAWHYTGSEVHLAVHFGLFARPEEQFVDFDDIHSVDSCASHKPADRIPVFTIADKSTAQDGRLRIPMVSHLRDPHEWRTRLEELVLLHQMRDQRSVEARCVIGETIIWCLIALHRQSTTSDALNGQIDPVVAAVLDDMKDPRTRIELQRLTVTQIAKKYGRSRSPFYAAFRKATGTGPREYILERQMEQASHLLINTDARIKDVALDVGIEDSHYFSRAFHKAVGLTPSEFRARSRATAPPDRQG